MVASGCADFTRSKVDELTEFVKSRGASGLISIGISSHNESLLDLDMSHVRSNIQRFLTPEHVTRLADRLNAVNGDLILLVAGDPKTTNASLGALRNLLGSELRLVDPNVLAFAFVTDFPLFMFGKITIIETEYGDSTTVKAFHEDGNLKFEGIKNK